MHGKLREVATQLTQRNTYAKKTRISNNTVNEVTPMQRKHIEVDTQFTKEHLFIGNT